MTDQISEQPNIERPSSGVREARELEAHLRWLESFTPLALGVLATASGIYTYLGVTTLLDGDRALSVLAALAYSIAVSVGIFVFWSYLLRLLPAMRSLRSVFGLVVAGALGSAAIIAMSSWLNAAALAGSAAVEQHLARTVQDYQSSLEHAYENAILAQGLGRDVSRARQLFEDLGAQEQAGNLSGIAGRGAVFRLLTQKADELNALETQIAAQSEPIAAAFEEGNAILARMRALLVEQGSVDARSVTFSEESVRLAGVITSLRQLSIAPLVARAAEDLAASVVLPELDGRTETVRADQQSTLGQILLALDARADSLLAAAQTVLDLPPPSETTYTPISSADAVIRYAENFVPSWAGAIAIDLLPAVLVFILAVTHSAIRRGRDGGALEDYMTISELRSAMRALEDIEMSMSTADAAADRRHGKQERPASSAAEDGKQPSGTQDGSRQVISAVSGAE